MSDNNEQKVLDDLEGKGRELPPLDSADSVGHLDETKEGTSKSGVNAVKVIKRIMIGFGVFVLLVVIVAAVFFATSDSVSSDEAPKSALEIAGEISVLEEEFEGGDALNPLLVDEFLEQSTRDQSHDDKNDAVQTEKPLERVLNAELNFKGAIDGFKEEVTGFNAELDQISGEFDLVKDRVFSVMAQSEGSLDRIVELENQVAYLVKEVKRLKWVERQKRVARKKVKKPELQVKSFFIWQYRPGVEIELSNGVSDRFYEGDLLNGMRLIHIDVDNEAVTLSKGAKRIVLKKQGGV